MKPITTVVNKATGELLEFPTANDREMTESYVQINELMGALDRAKKKIRGAIVSKLDESVDDVIEVGQFKWKKQIRHYLNYDLGTLRRVVDEGMYNTLVKPDKPKIDAMLKEIVDTNQFTITPEAVTELRSTMYDEKTPSVAVVLEKEKPA